MATVKEAVKETLVGTTREPLLSAQAKATFEKHARKDEETGELYMVADDFVDAIAPVGEDYVSRSFHGEPSHRSAEAKILETPGLIWCVLSIAQNQTRAIYNPLQCSRPSENGQDHPARMGHLRKPAGETGCRVRDCLPLVRRFGDGHCQI